MRGSLARAVAAPFTFALLLAGCVADETPEPVLACAPALPPVGWPGEPGILELDVPPQTGPFATAAHRSMPAVIVAAPVVIVSPKIVTVIAAGDPLAGSLYGFSDALATSAWWPAVSAEYGIGPIRGSVHVVGGAMPATMTVAAMIAYVKDAISAAGEGAAADGATVYVLHLAPGTFYTDGRAYKNCGCAELAGAHADFGGGNALAFVQRCSTSDVDELTSIASHEVIEAVTDPSSKGLFVPRSKPAWTGSVLRSNELADLCAGTRHHEGEWEYQRSFSNQAALAGGDPCVPALAEPYFNTSVADDWVPLTAGATTTVEVTGWSTAPTGDWFVYTTPQRGDGFEASVASDESSASDGVTFYGINNGKKATLQVKAPAKAPSGTTATVQLISRFSSPGTDVLHFWDVGFYVP